MHRDEKGRMAPAQSSAAKRMRMKAIVKSKHKNFARPAGVKAYTEAGRRLKKWIPQR